MKIRILISIFSLSWRSSLWGHSLLSHEQSAGYTHRVNSEQLQAFAGNRHAVITFQFILHCFLHATRPEKVETHLIKPSCVDERLRWALSWHSRWNDSWILEPTANIWERAANLPSVTCNRSKITKWRETRDSLHAMPCGELRRLTKLLPARVGSKVKVVFWENRSYCSSHANLYSSSLGPLRPDSFQDLMM